MRLASDAVRAAAESPFLADAVKRPSAILCSISLPSPKQRFAGEHLQRRLLPHLLPCMQDSTLPIKHAACDMGICKQPAAERHHGLLAGGSLQHAR